MKRKKRLEKGIESLKEQKEIHEEKKKQAAEAGNVKLVAYYGKEIKRFDKRIVNRDEKLHRK